MPSPYDPPEKSENQNPTPHPEKVNPRANRAFIPLILGLAAISVCWRLLSQSPILSGSGLLYIALPTALALIMARIPTAQSVTGRIMNGITLFLLLVGILLIEGFICIMVVSPLFYLIGGIVLSLIHI